MSKMINVPGTTDFVPLDDIINIKIKGRLVSKEELVIPTDPSQSFTVRVGSYAELLVVTSYLGDSDEDEDEDEEEEDVKGKKGKAIKKIEAEPKSEDKIATVSWVEIPLNSNPIVTDIDQSLVYSELDEKKQGQVDLRVLKYGEYLKALENRSELLDKLANLNPEPLEETEEGSSAIEEEDDAANTITGITTLTPIVRTPDEMKLKELNEFLENPDNNEDKQAKRIEYLEKIFNKSAIELECNDGFEFVKQLAAHNLGHAELNVLKEAVQEAVNDVSNLVG